MPLVSTRKLRVILFYKFNFRELISLICRTYYYHIRYLRQIRRNLPLSIANSISTLLLTNRLNCYNSLFFNIAIIDITKLQHVQHCLPRVVTRSSRLSHSKPLLMSLHWLPVRYLIIFKICAITDQPLFCKQPFYSIYMLTVVRKPFSFEHLVRIYFLSLNYSILVLGHLKTYLYNVAYPP